MKALLMLLRDSKNFVLFATFLLFLGVWIGYMYDEPFEKLLTEALSQLMPIIEDFNQNPEPSNLMLLIFSNNLRAAMSMLLLGIVFFIVPLSSLWINGLMVGYVVKMAQLEGASVGEMVVFGLLPHGVVEIPAVILAGGIGAFLGFRLLVWIFGRGQLLSHLFGNQGKSVGDFWNEDTLPILKRRFAGVVALVFALFVLLLIAAFIEGFITPTLLNNAAL